MIFKDWAKLDVRWEFWKIIVCVFGGGNGDVLMMVLMVFRPKLA